MKEIETLFDEICLADKHYAGAVVVILSNDYCLTKSNNLEKDLLDQIEEEGSKLKLPEISVQRFTKISRKGLYSFKSDNTDIPQRSQLEELIKGNNKSKVNQVKDIEEIKQNYWGNLNGLTVDYCVDFEAKLCDANMYDNI